MCASVYLCLRRLEGHIKCFLHYFLNNCVCLFRYSLYVEVREQFGGQEVVLSFCFFWGKIPFVSVAGIVSRRQAHPCAPRWFSVPHLPSLLVLGWQMGAPHPVGSGIKLRLLDSCGRYFMACSSFLDRVPLAMTLPPSLSLQHSDYRSVLLHLTFYMDPGNHILVFSACLAGTLTTELQMTSCWTIPGVL